MKIGLEARDSRDQILRTFEEEEKSKTKGQSSFEISILCLMPAFNGRASPSCTFPPAHTIEDIELIQLSI
jgi:hypothetical protein